MSKHLFRAFGAVQDTATRVVYGAEKATAKTSFYACVDKDLVERDIVQMSDFKNNVLLIVNVASK
jgi:hypothetical protein